MIDRVACVCAFNSLYNNTNTNQMPLEETDINSQQLHSVFVEIHRSPSVRQQELELSDTKRLTRAERRSGYAVLLTIPWMDRSNPSRLSSIPRTCRQKTNRLEATRE